MRLVPARRTLAVLTAAVAALAITATATPAATAADRPWTDSRLSPDRRAALLLAAMTLEEKVELMTGDQGQGNAAFYNAPIPRLGIPELRMADAGAGIAPRGWTLPGTGESATAMPSSISLAATFDPRVARRYAEVVAEEARQTGHEVLLGPNSDPPREPFWGRLAESSGEDPLLNASLLVPYVREVQGHNVITSLKHYTGYQQEVNRNVGQNSVIDERTLREVDTRAYEETIRRARLGAVMCAYNKVNGRYACENPFTENTVLRRQLGFRGFVLTDFGALHSTEPAIRAGTDMETGTRTFYDGALLAAVREGTVPERLVDRSVLRILRTMFAIGVFDTDYTPSAIPVREHGAAAADIQTRAITLLRNENRTLPLRRDEGGSLAVIGADAVTTSAVGGSALVEPTYRTPLLDALRARAASDGVDVRYAEGNDPVGPANMLETGDLTAVPSSVLTPDSGTGTGLTARYFGNATPAGTPGVTRTDRQVLYDTGFTGGAPPFLRFYASQLPPTPVLGANPIGGGQSARWTGWFTAPGTGAYRLGLTGWGDARLWLDDRLVADMTGADGRRDVRTAPLQLRAGERHRIRVDFAGTRTLGPLQPAALVLQWQPPAGATAPSIARAARLAARSDAAVVYVRTYEAEERDRVSLTLPQNATRLIEAVRRANPRTVVISTSGGPVAMPWARGVPAVLQNFFGGQEEGTALARVLFGDASPTGRLPVTFPRGDDALPPGVRNPWQGLGNLDVPFTEGVNIGYRQYLATGTRPQFPFGHGLTYTSFRYERLRVDGTHRVRVLVANTGRRAGTEVVQVYAGPPAGLRSPARKLAGLATARLAPGAHRWVTVDLDRRAFSYWDARADRWVQPRGTVRVYAGRSATDVRLVGTVRTR